MWVFGVPSAPRSLCPVAAGGGLLLEDVLGYDVTVRLPVVASLFACSPVTIWRMVQKRTLPAGRKISEGVTAWNVGELRKVLNGEVAQ